LMINIFNFIIVKNIKIWYFKNIHREESNNILYANIYFCLLLENKVKTIFMNSTQ
jgi:hypothetical protein